MLCTIKNNFHGTEVTLDVIPYSKLTEDEVEYARKQLCGMDDCHCNPFTFSDRLTLERNSNG